jgi:hypothetical protein
VRALGGCFTARLAVARHAAQVHGGSSGRALGQPRLHPPLPPQRHRAALRLRCALRCVAAAQAVALRSRAGQHCRSPVGGVGRTRLFRPARRSGRFAVAVPGRR